MSFYVSPSSILSVLREDKSLAALSSTFSTYHCLNPIPEKANFKKKKLKLNIGVCAHSETNSSLPLLLDKAHLGLQLKVNSDFTPD